MESCLLVVRSVGERTESLCKQLIVNQGIDSGRIVVVHAAPFSEALRRSFKLGIDAGYQWTCCVDADLLLRPGSLQAILAYAERQPPRVLQVQGFILDKFWGKPRSGGVHLYRTGLLHKALSHIPEEGTDIRPETYTLNSMEASGHPWVTLPLLVGLHDYEQYYSDIWRKFVVHAWKHRMYGISQLDRWAREAPSDPDVMVALKAFCHGLTLSSPPRIDARASFAEVPWRDLKVDEKEEASIQSIAQDTVEGLCRSYDGSNFLFSGAKGVSYLNTISERTKYLISGRLPAIPTARATLATGLFAIARRLRPR